VRLLVRKSFSRTALLTFWPAVVATLEGKRVVCHVSVAQEIGSKAPGLSAQVRTKHCAKSIEVEANLRYLKHYTRRGFLSTLKIILEWIFIAVIASSFQDASPFRSELFFAI
jgi:hypothetical protein